MYQIKKEWMLSQAATYKKEYHSFRPFSLSTIEERVFLEKFLKLVSSQDGQDVDDYIVDKDFFDKKIGDKIFYYLNKFSRDKKVLLLGVGSGRETLAANQLGFTTTGITLGSRNIDFGLEILNLPKEIHLEMLTESLLFKDLSFDIVAGFQIFEHSLIPSLFLAECFRVLKKDGILILEWPPAKALDGREWHGYENPHHQICYSPGQAKSLCLKAGFKRIDLFYPLEAGLEKITEEHYWTEIHKTYLSLEAHKE